MINPYANVTIASIPFDQDGEAGSLTYVFGHECPLEEFSDHLYRAALDWATTDEANEYVSVQGSYSIDWQEMIDAMSTEHLAGHGIANIGESVGTISLSDHEMFDLPELDGDEEGA
jgi:hypothetical protein